MKNILGKVIIGGVVVTGVAFAGVQHFSNAKATEEVDKIVAEAADVVEIKYGSAKGALFSSGVTISDISIKPVGTEANYQLETLEVSGMELGKKLQTSLCVSAEGIAIPLEPLYQEEDEYKLLGYGDTIRGALNMCYEFDRNNKTLEINEYSISAEDVGKISFKSKIGGLDFGIPEGELKKLNDEQYFERVQSLIEGNPMILMMYILPNITIIGAEATYKDDSFFSRLLEAVAKDDNTTVEEAKKDLIEEITNELKGQGQMETELREALLKFINKPKSLKMSIKPDSPIKIRDLESLKGYEDAFKIFNLHISG